MKTKGSKSKRSPKATRCARRFVLLARCLSPWSTAASPRTGQDENARGGTSQEEASRRTAASGQPNPDEKQGELHLRGPPSR